MQNKLISKQQKGNSETGKSETSREWLIHGAMRGSKEALQDLCKIVAQDVLFSASRILNNRSDAEDAAQEILIRLCMGIRDLQEPKAFDAWLGRITTNETRRIMMKNYRNDNVVSISDYIDSIEEENEEFLPHDCAIRQEDRRLILQIVDQLPARQREAVTLHYYNGLSVTETAEAMEVRHQVVSRYLKLARERIKEDIGNQESGAWASARGLAFLPMGSLLVHALRQEAQVFALSNTAWVQQAVINCPTIIGGTTKGVAVGAGLVKTVAAVAATAAITAGAWAGVSSLNQKEAEPPPPPPPSPPIIVQTSDYKVLFSGSDNSASQINPKGASAFVDTDHGEMKARFWWITPKGLSGNILFSGAGGVVDSTLKSMRDEGMDGDFTIYFRMEDAAGNTYTLTRDFTISS